MGKGFYFLKYMSFGSLFQTRAGIYASSVPTLDRSRRVAPSSARTSLTLPPPRAQASTGGAVDHWSAVLLYSIGFGAIAVGVLFLLVLAAVWLYGQFVWTFTQWDMADVRLAPYKRLAYLVVAGTFAAGTCFGLWCFSGVAWATRKAGRTNSAPVRRGSR